MRRLLLGSVRKAVDLAVKQELGFYVEDEETLDTGVEPSQVDSRFSVGQ